MAAQVIHYRFRLRRATAARWTSTNDLLYQGEIGVETDTNFMKLGDGVTHWNNLPYWNGAPISGFSNIADGQVLAWDATNSQWVPADAGKQYLPGTGIDITNPATATPTINSSLGSIALSGRVSAYSNLPTGLTTSDAGTAYLNDGDGLIYVWDGSAWPAQGKGVSTGSGSGVAVVNYGDTSALGSADVGAVVFYHQDPTPESHVSLSPWALWTLDETTGNFLDTSGNGRDATPGTTYPPNRGFAPLYYAKGGSAEVGGQDVIGQYVESGTFGTVFSATFWMKVPDSTHNSNINGQFFKVGQNGAGISLMFADNTDNGPSGHVGRYIEMNYNGVIWNRISAGPISNASQVIHVGFVLNGSNAQIYINGNPVGKLIKYGSPNIANKEVRIGAGENVGSGGNSTVSQQLKFSQVAIYAGILSDADMRTIAQTVPPTPKGVWNGSGLTPLA